MRDTERVAPSRNDAANKQILYKHTVRKGPLHHLPPRHVTRKGDV